MQFLYTIGIRCYAFLLRIVAPFHPKAKLWVKGRKNVFQTLEKALSGNIAKIIWMHVSSLGEFEQGRPVIEQIKENYPSYKIVLTFFSPSGYEIRKNYPLADVIVYLPIDTPTNAKRFLDIVKPEKVFFVKYDFWYHYLNEVRKRKIPAYLISALFRKEQLFFKPYGGFYRNILQCFTHIFVQDENSAKLLNDIGYEAVTTCGDTRVDRVATLSEQVKTIAYVEAFKQDDLLLIAGSSWQPDEDILVEYLKKNKDKLKVVFAPHEVHDAHIQQLEKKLAEADLASVRYSSLTDETLLGTYNALIIDSIGMLSSLYQYADIAYIGGGFGAGIHNTLEPAAFGLPILFGKKYQKFNEAVELVKRKGAFSIANYQDFAEKMQPLVTDIAFRKQAGAISKNFIDKQKGATGTVVSYCFHKE